MSGVQTVKIQIQRGQNRFKTYAVDSTCSLKRFRGGRRTGQTVKPVGHEDGGGPGGKMQDVGNGHVFCYHEFLHFLMPAVNSRSDRLDSQWIRDDFNGASVTYACGNGKQAAR